MKRLTKNVESVLVNLLRKRILWILFGLALFGLLLLIAMPLGIEYGFKRYLISQGVDQIHLEDVDFNPFTRRLAVKNLTVEVDNEQVLNVSEADFTLSWFSFFKKRFLLEKVEFNNSTITIEELPDGRWRIGGLSPKPSAPQSSTSSWGYGLRKLQIQNSLFKFRSSQLTSELKVEQAQLTRLRTWRPDQRTRLELSGQLNDSRLQFQGDLSPFGGGITFDGSIKLDGLAITPFARLMASDPRILRGRLDADVRIQTQYSSKQGFNFSQSGRLVLKQPRMRFGDVEFADENFNWNGTVQVKLPAASDEFQIAVTGQLEGKDGVVNPTPDKLAFQHKGLDWNGKFVLDRKTQTADYTFNGALALHDFKMATPEMNLAEESFRWDGNVGVNIPYSTGGPRIAAAGELAGKGASLESPSASFKLQGTGLNWNGAFDLALQTETADVKLDGDLKLATLEVVTADALLAEEDLRWSGGFQLFRPENSAAQRLETSGKLEARRQTITLLRQNLNFANENLTWQGRFNFGLKDFTADLTAEGDFGLTDLAITATRHNLKLLASKAVTLKSIKADTGKQFSVTAAKIIGVDLIGQTNAPKDGSLFSAAEVQIDTVKLEQLKKISIGSARIVAARAMLHHKKDGRWRYIDDLTTYLADSGTGAQRKPSQPGAEANAQIPVKNVALRAGIQIGSLEIVGDSLLQFEDDTVSPAFSTEVRLVEARVTDINSDRPDQASPITLEAASRKYTHLKLQANVQSFGERFSMDLKGKIKALEMPPLSPYAVKTLGYDLISGEMDADIDLKIIVGQIEGEGDLKFYKPVIAAVSPEKLQNKEGRPIPLQSALKVLRDKDDDVRLKIPISGDMTDPQFNFADAINQAVIKGLSLATLSYLKYMLGPYGVAIGIIELGAKVGTKALSGIRLKPVEFQPGASELEATMREYVDKVASILKEKKDLRLRLCGWATEGDRMGQRKGAATPAEAQSPEKGSMAGKIAAQKDGGFALSEAEMLTLAEQRANRIEDYLVTQHGIKDKRIFICAPALDKNPEAPPRVEMVF